MRFVHVTALLVLCAAPVAAQSPTPKPAPMPKATVAQSADPLVASVRAAYEEIKDYMIRSAQKMPEDKYDFRPTPEVRTFGEIIGHVAGANMMFCAAAKGEKVPAESQFENLKTKAELVKALSDSFAYCDDAYHMSDAAAARPMAQPLFGQSGNRMLPLVGNVTHDNSHYGNLVTYFRINGIVPPSSERPGG